MGEISWIKLDINMFNDEKIKLIRTLPDGNSIVLFWIQLLLAAGKTNDHGLVYLGDGITYTDEMLATITGFSNSMVRSGIKTLKDFGMISIDENGFIAITNWDKYQNIEGMDKIREQNRIRKRKQREREKQAEIEADSKSHVTSRDSHATDEEEDKEEDKDIDIDTSFIQGQNDGLYVLPLKNNKNFYITEKYINQLSEHFESLNLHNEILMMGEWLSEDESRLKDENYMNTFIENWLSQSLENKTKGKREKERSRK